MDKTKYFTDVNDQLLKFMKIVVKNTDNLLVIESFNKVMELQHEMEGSIDTAGYNNVCSDIDKVINAMDTVLKRPSENITNVVEEENVGGTTCYEHLNVKMVTRKTWKEFRETGLLQLVNQFLHIFGWSLVIEYQEVLDKIVEVYPARVRFRGFSEESNSRAYRRISKYMKDNAWELEKEANE